jgi:cytosine/adenosine deaminase-related metal-dependent hydrolase
VTAAIKAHTLGSSAGEGSMGADYLIRDGAVVSVDPAVGTVRGGSVHVRGGAIVDVGVSVDAPDAEVIDASGMIVMPGLIDSHHHMWSALGRNFLSDGFEYYPAKWATSAAYEPEDFYNSVTLALAECIRAGITTVHNWSHNTRSPAHADAELAAHREAFVRARYSYGHRDLLPDDEPLDFTDIDRVATSWFGADSPFGGLLHLGVNLRGPDAGPAQVFHSEMEEARGRGLPVAIHASQGPATQITGPDFESRGYLGPSMLLCHYLPATQADREAMARTSTPLSWAMHSELRLGEAGDPRAALLAMVDAGVNVSLSTDATSLGPVNLFEAMNVAWSLGIPWQGTGTASCAPLSFKQCIEMATTNGARALGLGDVTGSLTPGKRADLVLIRAHDLNVAPAVDLEATIVRSVTPANVDTVLVDGRVLKRGGHLIGLDVDDIVRKAEKSARAVRTRAGGRLAPGESGGGGRRP